MSLILDALRKSERSRQQSLTGRLGTADAPPAATRIAVPWATLLGLLLLINAVVLAVLFWPRAEPPADAAVAPVPAATAPTRQPEVRPLAQEAATDATAPAAAMPTAPPPPSPASLPAQNPVDEANVPSLDSLPADFRQSLPALHLDVHAYAAKAAERFVVINLQHYRIGDTLAEGPKVVDILPQGVVLEFHGTTFLLPAS